MATRSRRGSPSIPDRSEDTSKARVRSPLVAAVNREVRERDYVSPSEAAQRRQLSQLPPPTVKRALVHATSVLTTRDQERVLSVDMRPLVIHLLAALEQAGIERAVVTLGHNATQVAECVTEYGFTRLHIDFVYLTLGSAVGAVWCSLANSVIAARALFTGKEPLIIVRADNLYDCRLLRKIADAPFGKNRRLQAYALVDDTPTAVGWATSVRNLPRYMSQGGAVSPKEGGRGIPRGGRRAERGGAAPRDSRRRPLSSPQVRNNWARVALATHDPQCA